MKSKPRGLKLDVAKMADPTRDVIVMAGERLQSGCALETTCGSII
jgi:hypothetical protein